MRDHWFGEGFAYGGGNQFGDGYGTGEDYGLLEDLASGMATGDGDEDGDGEGYYLVFGAEPHGFGLGEANGYGVSLPDEESYGHGNASGIFHN